MGESAVLLRSFSHPSDASREGDPIRALTESVSFGRFMSESLAWEKWSTFSHNRYLEEVEKFSKPGSVAEKKAYFEAHYKKKAAMKAAAVEEANAAFTDTPESKITSDIQDNSHMASMTDATTDCHMVTGSADKISHVAPDEQLKNRSVNTEVAPVDANASYSINARDDSGHANRERDETVIEYPVNAENSAQADNLKLFHNPDVHNEIEATSLEIMPHKEANNQENSAPSSKKNLACCSPKSSSKSGVSRLTSYPTKQAPSSLPARNVNNNIATNGEVAANSNGKKKAVPKSLHKSINFSPRISETSKASLKTPTRASVNGISKHLSKFFQSEDKRSKALVSKSVSGGITEAVRLQSPSTECLKSSSTKGSKPRPTFITSPFSFKSEERVAKRKEFFQKLEEKNNPKEAENSLLETRSKDKAEPAIKKLRRSTVKTKQNESLHHGSHLPNGHMKKEKAEHDFKKVRQSSTGFKFTPNAPSPTDQMKKKPICSPKLGGKANPMPTPSLVLDTCSSQPPRRPSAVNTESSKSTTCSVTSLPKRGGKAKPNPMPSLVLDTCSSRPPRRPSAVNTESSKSTTRSVTSLPKLGRRPTSKSNTVQDPRARPVWRTSMNIASFKRGDGIEKNHGSTNHRSVASLPKKNAARENASPNIQH